MRALYVPIVMLALACGGGPAAEAGPEPPRIPWWQDGTVSLAVAPPALGPCPEGWFAVTSEGPQVCEPWPAGGPRDCPAGEAHFPGEPGCRTVGSPCPAGDFPDDLPAESSVLFVRAGATAGDGTRARPYGRIADALAEASGRVTIAVAAGRYDEAVELRHGLVLRGACTTQTILTSSTEDSSAGTLTLLDGEAEVQDIRIGESARSGVLAAGSGTTLRLRGVAVDGVTGFGILVRDGATVDAEELVVAGTRERPDMTLGRGLNVFAGGAAAVSRGVFVGNRETGVSVGQAGSSVSLTDVAIRGTLARTSDGMLGHGLRAGMGATASVERSVVEANRELGVLAESPGTTLHLADVVVRGNVPGDRGGGRGLDVESGAIATAERLRLEGNSDVALFAGSGGAEIHVTDVVIRDTMGRGAVAEDGALLEVTRGLLERNQELAVLANGAGASIRLRDVVVRDTRGLPGDGSLGGGLAVQLGASLRVETALLEGNRRLAVFAGATGTSLDLIDVVVRDTLADDSDGSRGRGLTVQEGATARVERAVLLRNRDVGVLVDGIGSRLTLIDAVVSETAEETSTGGGGRGIGAQNGAAVDIERALIEGNRDSGLLAHGADTSLLLTDVRIRGTRSQPDGTFGRGIVVQEGATMTAARAHLEEQRQVGVFVLGTGSSAILSDVEIRGTLPAECDAERCPATGGGGTGLGVYFGGRATLTRFVLADSALCGVQLADAADVDLVDGEVRANAIGACVQIDGYDVARLTQGVEYVGNDRAVETTSLPVPDSGAPLTGL